MDTTPGGRTRMMMSPITKMKSNGFRALPCLKPMFTWNSFDIHDPTTTLPLVFSYIASTIFTSDSTIHCRVAIAIFSRDSVKGFV